MLHIANYCSYTVFILEYVLWGASRAVWLEKRSKNSHVFSFFPSLPLYSTTSPCLAMPCHALHWTAGPTSTSSSCSSSAVDGEYQNGRLRCGGCNTLCFPCPCTFLSFSPNQRLLLPLCQAPSPHLHPILSDPDANPDHSCCSCFYVLYISSGRAVWRLLCAPQPLFPTIVGVAAYQLHTAPHHATPLHTTPTPHHTTMCMRLCHCTFCMLALPPPPCVLPMVCTVIDSSKLMHLHFLRALCPDS